MEEKEKTYREEEANKKLNAEKKVIFTEKTNNIQVELNEANEIAKNFNRNMFFSFELIGGVGNQHQTMGSESVDKAIKKAKESVQINVADYDNEFVFAWHEEKFNDRLMIMRDSFAYYESEGELP